MSCKSYTGHSPGFARDEDTGSLVVTFFNEDIRLYEADNQINWKQRQKLGSNLAKYSKPCKSMMRHIP
jgi:hypothetical protein